MIYMIKYLTDDTLDKIKNNIICPHCKKLLFSSKCSNYYFQYNTHFFWFTIGQFIIEFWCINYQKFGYSIKCFNFDNVIGLKEIIQYKEIDIDSIIENIQDIINIVYKYNNNLIFR